MSFLDLCLLKTWPWHDHPANPWKISITWYGRNVVTWALSYYCDLWHCHKLISQWQSSFHLKITHCKMSPAKFQFQWFNTYTHPSILILVSKTDTTISLSNVTSLATSLAAFSNSSSIPSTWNEKYMHVNRDLTAVTDQAPYMAVWP